MRIDRCLTRFLFCAATLAACGSAMTALAGGTAPEASTAAQAPQASAQKSAAFTPLAHVETRGTGSQHVILIPGLGCDWTVFESFMARNAGAYTMHAVTLPGFAGSEPPPLASGSSYEDSAWLKNAEAAIVALINEKKLDKPMVIGHWLGGHVAIRIAAHNPGLLKSAVSLDGYPALAMNDPEKGGEVTREDRIKLVRDFIAPSMEREDLAKQLEKHSRGMVLDESRAQAIGAMMSSTPTPTLVRYALELSTGDVIAEMKTLSTPLLIVATVPDDAVVPDEAMREGMRSRWTDLLKGIPNTTLVYFENCRMFVMDDAPKELDAAIASFAAGTTVSGKPRS